MGGKIYEEKNLINFNGINDGIRTGCLWRQYKQTEQVIHRHRAAAQAEILSRSELLTMIQMSPDIVQQMTRI